MEILVGIPKVCINFVICAVVEFLLICFTIYEKVYLFFRDSVIHQKRNAFFTQCFLQLHCNTIHHRFLRKFFGT